MEVTFKITDTIASLQKAFLNEFRDALDKAIKGAIPNIKSRVGELVANLVRATPEYASIMSGQLNYELGIRDPANALNQITDALQNGIVVNYTGLVLTGSGIGGGFVIGMVKEKFSELTSLSGVKYMSGSNEIPWLEWLLFKGDEIIISDYEIKYSTNSSKSRTNNALMVKSNKGWRMPLEFSGDENDNFITRAFTDNTSTESLIGRIVEEEIIRRM